MANANDTKTDGWHDIRRSAIGASELAAVLGLSRRKTAWEVWAEKTGRLEPWRGNDATLAGQRFESAVLDYAESELGELIRDRRIVANSCPVAATCDAIVAATGEPVEAKTTGLVGPVYGYWGESLSDDVPDEYLVQVHAQMLCTGADIGHLFALIAGRGVVQFRFQRNPDLQEYFVNSASEWWQAYVVADKPPPIDNVPSLETVKRLKHTPGKTIVGTVEMSVALTEREYAKQQVAHWTKQSKEAERLLLLEIGDAEHVDFGDRLVTRTTVSRRGYTVAPCEYRQITVKKVKEYGKD